MLGTATLVQPAGNPIPVAMGHQRAKVDNERHAVIVMIKHTQSSNYGSHALFPLRSKLASGLDGGCNCLYDLLDEVA